MNGPERCTPYNLIIDKTLTRNPTAHSNKLKRVASSHESASIDEAIETPHFTLIILAILSTILAVLKDQQFFPGFNKSKMSGRITKSGSRRDLVSYKREWSPSLARALLETDKPGSGEFRSAPTPCNSPTSSSGRPIRGGRAARALYTGSMSRRARSEPYPGRGAFQFVGPASPSHDAKWKAKYEGRDGVERRMFAAKSNTGVESSRQSSVVCEQFKKEDAFKAKPTVVPPIFLGVGNSFGTNSSQIGNVDWCHLEDSSKPQLFLN